MACAFCRDADPGSGAVLTPGFGMGKKQDPNPGSGSGMNIPDHISESLETIFWVKNTLIFYADQDPGSGIFLTLDPGSGMEKFGPEIRDKHPGSASLVFKAKTFLNYGSFSAFCHGFMFSKPYFLKLLFLGARSRRSKRAVQPLEGEEDDEDLPRDIAASIQVCCPLFLQYC
jgi:hypothetical protein